MVICFGRSNAPEPLSAFSAFPQPFTISPSIHEVALGSAHLSVDKRAQDDLARMADELAALIIQGAVRLPPIEVIPWQEIPAGLDRLADGHVRGKIVAQVRTN